TGSHGSVGPFDLGGAARSDRLADPFAAALGLYARDRTSGLRRRRVVCPGCGGSSAGEAFTGWPRRKGGRFLRRSRGKGGATRGGRRRCHGDRPFGRAVEKA